MIHITKILKKINLTMLAYAILISLILSLSIALQAFSYESTAQQRIADEIIRFHVLANSDDAQDQELKMQVKEAVLKKMEPILQGSPNIHIVRELINENIHNIESVARYVLYNHGITDSVSASLARVHFPQITYTNMTLPQGYYEALQISIGSGSGQNWWCVMFPMLCFVDGIAGPKEEMEELMAQVLTEEEYQQVFNVRFRTADWWLN